jgi:simple sugar transport system ATP-binding protein
MVLLHRIHKTFVSNGIKALDGADFELRDGEIHALVGENGAGKSTLMHVMAGFLKCDEGTIIVDGREQRLASPSAALAEGIGMVRQHPRLVPSFSVWENCALGPEFSWKSKRHVRAEIAVLNERWGFDLPLDRPAAALTVSQGQKAAILALLRRRARYLVFDEPTAVLSPGETDALFEVFAKLKEEGKGVVLISHKLNEILRAADRITVLGRGKTTAVLDASGTGENQLAALIFGASRNVSGRARPGKAPAGLFPAPRNEPPALELQDFTVNVPGRPLIRGVNLALRRGGITGIAGVRDSGLETLELAVAGYLPSSGMIRINGTRLANRFSAYGNNVRAFRNAGGSYLGTWESGAAESSLSLRDILVIHAHRRFARRGFLDTKKLADWSRRIIKGAGIGIRSDTVSPLSFSGGQFQRIVCIREIAEQSPLFLAAEPGRGLDRKGRDRLAAIFRERAADGTGVLIFSTDSEDLLSVCDTVMVLRDGFFPDVIELNRTENGEDTAAEMDSVQDIHERIRKAMVGER